MKRIYLGLSIFLLTLNTYAAPDSYADQVPIDRTITSMYAYDTFVFVNFSPSFQFNQNCDISDGNVRVVIDTSNELGRNLYSAALTAASANKQVGFGVKGCHIDRPKAYRIDVKF